MLEFFFIFLPIITVFILIKLGAPKTKFFWKWDLWDILYAILAIPIGLAVGGIGFFLYLNIIF